jgi:hypothetical protein
MKRTAWLLVVALIGCVDSGCPEGSEEVDGICMEQSSPLTGDAGPPNAGSGGGSAAPDAGNEPNAPTGREDASAPGGSDGSSPVCEGDDCEMPVTCDPTSTDPACACEAGFERATAGGQCADIDECATATAGCDAHATCRNEPGAFTCECQPGYEGDGTTCIENPCEPRVNPCDAETTVCRADGGAAVCECLEGFGRCDADVNACNTDLRSNRENCGACEAACAGDLACDGGVCEQAVTQLALGLTHSCAIARDGQVLCWGANNYDLLARADATRPLHEPAPTRLGQARLIAATTELNCMLSTGNDLTCWGNNSLQRIDADSPTGMIMVTLGQGLASIDEIALGLVHGCVRAGDGIECWGLNDGSVLGNATDGRVTFGNRRNLDLPESPAQLSVGRINCIVGQGAELRCWGGQGGAAPYSIMDGAGEPLAAVRDVAIATSWELGCVALMDGRALCWGENSSGQLGNPAATDASLPHAVVVADANGQALSGVEQVAVGYEHACARLQSGTVVCWGRRDRLGSGATGTSAQRYASAVVDIDDAIDVVAGANHTCVRRRSGQLQCWGNNATGQLGVNPNTASGGTASAAAPVNVLSLP